MLRHRLFSGIIISILVEHSETDIVGPAEMLLWCVQTAVSSNIFCNLNVLKFVVMQEGLLTPAVATTVTRLTSHVLDMPLRARDLDLDEWLAKPNPEKWSKMEILGHLVDSAINNLKRFTDAQIHPQPYRITPYQQDDLVNINAYQQLPFDHILQMWVALNQQILYVVANIPADKLNWQVIIPNGEVKTLGWWIDDYADHMEHHLRQIFG